MYAAFTSTVSADGRIGSWYLRYRAKAPRRRVALQFASNTPCVHGNYPSARPVASQPRVAQEHVLDEIELGLRSDHLFVRELLARVQVQQLVLKLRATVLLFLQGSAKRHDLLSSGLGQMHLLVSGLGHPFKL